MIPPRLQNYFAPTLSSGAPVPVDSALAFRLRPDLWASATNTAGDFASAWQKLDGYFAHIGVKLYTVEVEGRADVIVATRSDHSLLERLLWATGLQGRSVAPVPALATPKSEGGAPFGAPGPDVPDYPCNERAEHFRGRGERDPMFRGR
ncbi:MAG: hypothetical protein ACT4P4_25765 [Betaproteobacteria bacterium]